MEETLNLNDDSLFNLDWDIDLKLTSNKNEELVTSASACTPGCGNTGSFNSFCC